MAVDILEYAGGTDYFDTMEYVFEYHGIDLNQIFKILFGKAGKKKTILLCGCANAGKTLIVNFLASLYKHWEIGKAGPQDIRSAFWLQDLVGKQIHKVDEAYCTDVNIDTLKLLAEGNPSCSTQIKFWGLHRIYPKPVLMASNNVPWAAMPKERSLLMERSYFLNLQKALPKNLSDGRKICVMETFSGEVALALRLIWTKLNLEEELFALVSQPFE